MHDTEYRTDSCRGPDVAPGGGTRNAACQRQADLIMYMATECPEEFRPPPTARQRPEGWHETPRR